MGEGKRVRGEQEGLRDATEVVGSGCVMATVMEGDTCDVFELFLNNITINGSESLYSPDHNCNSNENDCFVLLGNSG